MKRPKCEANATNDLVPTRQSLLSRLKDWSDKDSWYVFFETYWRLIYTAAREAGLGDAEAQDVVQETVISVSRNIPEFKYDPAKGSFKGWLLRLTSWRITDHLRKQQRELRYIAVRDKTGLTGTDEIERVPDPVHPKLESIWNEEWERNLMEAAIERVKKKVDLKAFQAFDLYVLRDWPVSQVAKALKVNRGQVYLTKHRINRLIRKEIQGLIEKPL